MKSKFSIYVTVCFLMLSCNNKSKPAESSTTLTQETDSACYKYVSTGDTVTLKLVYVGEAITGNLVYKLKEKDKNMGTIQGKMRGDLLLADYTFMSEGMTSVRQIAFKKQADYFVEGYADVETIDGKTSFKNLDSLKFIDKIKLIASECKN